MTMTVPYSTLRPHKSIAKVSPLRRPLRTKAKAAMIARCRGTSMQTSMHSSSLLGNLRQSYVRRGAASSSFQVPACFTFRDEDESNDSTSGDGSSSCVASKKVTFAPTVSFAFIPARTDYSIDQKKRLWNSKRAIRQAAAQSVREWHYEGRCWENAVEEKHFCYVHGTGFVHPVHVLQGVGHYKYWENATYQT
jgi:hypothetical protein